MGAKHKPRSGSLQFYPRKKAKKETPSFSSFPEVDSEQVKPLNFFGYKAGMLHGIARDEHKKGVTSGMQVQVPLTVIECPSLRVFGIRAYGKAENGTQTLMDVIASKTEKHLARKIAGIQKKKREHSIEALEKRVNEITGIRLLVHTQPYATGIGKKKPAVSELALSGKDIGKQIEYSKQKLGKEISVKEVFQPSQFVDVRAVTTGKGMQGPVKRFGVKTHRPKAKKQRTVGTLGPWNPSTVMWTVARPGQMGYHSRTEFNKRILAVESEGKKLNPSAGFGSYGAIKNESVLLVGSVPGPVKRLVAMRFAIRPTQEHNWNVSDLQLKKE